MTNGTVGTDGNVVGPLAGLRVIELSDEKGSLTGKLMADMGANVILVEPPAGDRTRAYGPFVDDEPGPERSLWFWYYNTSKRGITLNLDSEAGRALFKRLVGGADILVESEPPGRLATLGLDYADLRPSNPGLIMVSMTPYGRSGPRSQEPVTDLTLLAGGGPVWSCGYDDHSIPPVRGGGNQGYHTGCHFAVMSALVALLYRDRTGQGQFIDVNMYAAQNVTTEAASYTWLVSRQTVQRQTGRHAGVQPSQPLQIQCADGRYVNTGVFARTPDHFRRLHGWLEDAGLVDEFPLAPVLMLAAERKEISLARIAEDEEMRMMFEAGREAVNLLASRLSGYDFFTSGQNRGFQLSLINSPEEALETPHMAARGFAVDVEHPEVQRTVRYPGAPYRFEKTPWHVRRRAPQLGEDNAEVYHELGLRDDDLARLRAEGAI